MAPKVNLWRENLPKVGSGRARPQRIRPHWWAVLAVSLSLLALVAAATSEHTTGHGTRGRHVAASRNRKATEIPPTPRPLRLDHHRHHVNHPSREQRNADDLCPDRETGHYRATARRHHHVNHDHHCTPDDDTTTTSTTASTIGSAPAPQTRSGDLQQPYVASATYPFTGAGAMRISANWSPNDSLSLLVSCPNGSQTAVGTSSAAVVIADADGPCDLTLKIMLVQYDVVSYTLTIASAGG